MTEAEAINQAGGQLPPAPTASRLHVGALYASPLAAGTKVQEFEISAVIGQGGFGIVYLARDLSLQRSVAIKEYMPTHLAGRDAECTVRPLTAGQSEVFELGRRSFINEARMLARFKHPGLVEVLRFWEQNGTAYMAMPYYDGATLTQYLKRHPGVATEPWLKNTLRPLVDALGHMHEENCFHRDVAPDNILILKDGTAVLLDLGAARRVIADDAQAMTVMLKPGYAPIEQYSDDPRIRQGPWTDIYAMAAVFFFGVTGKAPPASASRVMRDSVSPLAEVLPKGFSEPFLLAIDKGLSLQPDDRPRSIAEFRSLLYASPSPSSPSSRPQPPSPQPTLQPPPARRPDAKPVDRSVEIDDPFAPPAAGAGTAMRVAAGVAMLALVLAGAWYAMQPAVAPVDAEAVLALPAAGSIAAGASKPAVPADAGVAAPVVTAPIVAAPVVTAPVVTAPQNAAASAPAVTPPVPARPATATTTEPATTATGILVLDIKPWAEVRVDGVRKGISPPVKQLTLPAGRHTIELRNGASAPVTKQLEVRADRKTVVRQQF
jgi:serine/threonine protein kinase